MLRLKTAVNPRILEKYGFELGQEFVDRGERCICNPNEYQDYWKFAMNPEDPGEILYTDECNDQAMLSIHVQSSIYNRLWIEGGVPTSSYHIEGWDFDTVTNTLFNLISDGLLEVVDE